MEPKLVEQPGLMLVGIVDAAPNVTELDIHGLWERFQVGSDVIKHQVEGAGYELHVQVELEPTMHFCMVASEVTKIEDIPTESKLNLVGHLLHWAENGHFIRPAEHYRRILESRFHIGEDQIFRSGVCDYYMASLTAYQNRHGD